MKTISISDSAHEKMTQEIKDAENKGAFPKLTHGMIVEEMTNKRYKNKNK